MTTHRAGEKDPIDLSGKAAHARLIVLILGEEMRLKKKIEHLRRKTPTFLTVVKKSWRRGDAASVKEVSQGYR